MCTIYRLIHMMKTRSVHRMLWTTVKPNSESHCRPWWRDLKRIKNGCTGFLARRWYVCLITWILFDPHASFRSCVSPMLVWQLQLANHSRSQLLLGHSGRTCTELAWMGQTLYSTPPLSSWLTLDGNLSSNGLDDPALNVHLFLFPWWKGLHVPISIPPHLCSATIQSALNRDLGPVRWTQQASLHMAFLSQWWPSERLHLMPTVTFSLLFDSYDIIVCLFLYDVIDCVICIAFDGVISHHTECLFIVLIVLLSDRAICLSLLCSSIIGH